MEFIKKIEKKLKRKYALYAISMIILSVLLFAGAIAGGFSSEKNTKIVLRGTDAGVAVSDGFLSVFLIIGSIGFLVGAFCCLKAGINNKNFKLFVKKLEEIGDINVISEALSKTEKSKYAKNCELRYNSYVIFFMEGTDVTAINPKTIYSIKAQMVRDRNYIKPCVSIYYGNTVTHIETQKNKNKELCYDIISKCNLIIYGE